MQVQNFLTPTELQEWVTTVSDTDLVYWERLLRKSDCVADMEMCKRIRIELKSRRENRCGVVCR